MANPWRAGALEPALRVFEPSRRREQALRLAGAPYKSDGRVLRNEDEVEGEDDEEDEEGRENANDEDEDEEEADSGQWANWTALEETFAPNGEDTGEARLYEFHKQAGSA